LRLTNNVRQDSANGLVYYRALLTLLVGNVRARRGEQMPTFAEVGRTIEQNLDTFKKPGSLAVRPGYRIEAGWPVGDPIIVALVGAKKGEAASYGVPSAIGGVPIVVREASPLGRMKATRPAAYLALADRIRSEQRAPDFPFEHAFAEPAAAEAVDETAARRPGKEEIPYQPAPRPLDPISGTLSMICSASPDAGWPVLRDFFARIEQKLTVGMYDFTSAHILLGLGKCADRRRQCTHLVAGARPSGAQSVG
jgi:hypothetical protein